MFARKFMHPSVCFLGFTPGKTEPSDFVDNDMPATRRMEDYQPGQYCIKNQGTKAYLALVSISIADCTSSTWLMTCQTTLLATAGLRVPNTCLDAWLHTLGLASQGAQDGRPPAGANTMLCPWLCLH